MDALKLLTTRKSTKKLSAPAPNKAQSNITSRFARTGSWQITTLSLCDRRK